MALAINIPPLTSGDRLTRREFERRYAATPEKFKAELIEGVVYVASPVRFASHGEPHTHIITWLGTYCAATPGVRMGDNTTIRMDPFNEPQPDVVLRLNPAVGGRSQVSPDDYLEGAPELQRLSERLNHSHASHRGPARQCWLNLYGGCSNRRGCSQ
jgi:hypothetical protein